MNQMTVQQERNQKVSDFKRTMSQMIGSGDFALPDTVTPERFRNTAIVAVQENPDILNCRPESVFKSLRRCAASGLLPDGREAAMIPFKGECTFIPMVQGLVKMARRSGTVRSIRSHVIYQKELDEGRFEFIAGDREELTHHPILFGDRGEPIGVYAVAELTSGDPVRAVMTAEDVEKIRKEAASQGGAAKPKGVWLKHEMEMWKKTAIRRVCKMLDLSADDMRVIMDDDAVVMRDVSPDEPEHDGRPTGSRGVKRIAPDLPPESSEPGTTEGEAVETIDGETGEVITETDAEDYDADEVQRRAFAQSDADAKRPLADQIS